MKPKFKFEIKKERKKQLSADQVIQIYDLLHKGYSSDKIAPKFNQTRHNIHAIMIGKIHRELFDEYFKGFGSKVDEEIYKLKDKVKKIETQYQNIFIEYGNLSDDLKALKLLRASGIYTRSQEKTIQIKSAE